MNFWEILGVPRGADVPAIRKAYRKMSLAYHPDKGGDAKTFAFLNMVHEVLCDPEKRRRYEFGGPEAFTNPFRQSNGDADEEEEDFGDIDCATEPPINRRFLEKLLGMQGAYSLKIGTKTMADYVQAVLDANDTKEPGIDVMYQECKLAKKLNIKLRLVPQQGECPVYSMPRVIRHAAFSNVDIIELDFPACHGQQLYKYAKRHGIASPLLEEAFSSTERVMAFRKKQSHGIPPEEVKRVCNMIAYGAGKKLLGELPRELKMLKAEVERLREHMWRESPEAWRNAVKDREHPKLTLCSIHCQIGERRDLETVVRKLDDGVSTHGYLGDSVLVSDNFDHEAFIARMAAMDIHVTTKAFPKNEEEYFKYIATIVEAPFSRTALTSRQRRRVQARKYAARWLATGKDDEGERGPMPHLDFAIAIEDHLPTAYNPVTKKTEFYNIDEGVWYSDGGQLISKGEVLSEALIEVFGKPQWKIVDEGGKARLRLTSGDVPLFHSGPVLGSIGSMCGQLRFDTSLPALDRTPNASKLVNFQGQFTLDFSIAKPAIDWSDDEQLSKALALPVRESMMSDRTMRSVPRPFEDYTNPSRLKLARAMQAAMLDLKDNDVLSDAIKAQLSEVAPEHPMMLHCFYEAHNDWDSALMQARLVFEPCSDTGVRCQVSTFKDAGDGSTAKGTLRELCESSLGTYNGDAQLGYSCVLTQETIQTKKQEAPSEQTSNLFLCKHAWVDDFKPSKPLCTAVLRQLSGGNNITAARKHGREHQFKFRGQLFLVTNGTWTPDVPWVGADARRATGLSFDVRFVDEPAGPNERPKDSGIKENIANYFAEFWFMARVFWLVTQPRGKSDQTMPQCPNTLALTNEILGGQFDTVELDKPVVDEFVATKLIAYVNAPEKPSSAQEVDTVFANHVRTSLPGFTDEAARRTLRKHLTYKPGHVINKCGHRKRTSVNVYIVEGVPQTLRPVLFGGAAASSSG